MLEHLRQQCVLPVGHGTPAVVASNTGLAQVEVDGDEVTPHEIDRVPVPLFFALVEVVQRVEVGAEVHGRKPDREKAETRLVGERDPARVAAVPVFLWTGVRVVQ